MSSKREEDIENGKERQEMVREIRKEEERKRERRGRKVGLLSHFDLGVRLP